MKKVGILGDIGSGKSFISKQFGFPVFNADKEVQKIYNKDKSCYRKLHKQLPKFIYSFPIKKHNLIRAIMSNSKNLNIINKTVHPIVRKKLKKFFLKNNNKKMVIIDIPLLLENKLNSKNYILIFIEAKRKIINKKLKQRKNYNFDLIKKLKKIQYSPQTKKKLSNYIIRNNFRKEIVKKRVIIIKKEILKI